MNFSPSCKKTRTCIFLLKWLDFAWKFYRALGKCDHTLLFHLHTIYESLWPNHHVITYRIVVVLDVFLPGPLIKLFKVSCNSCWLSFIVLPPCHRKFDQGGLEGWGGHWWLNRQGGSNSWFPPYLTERFLLLYLFGMSKILVPCGLSADVVIIIIFFLVSVNFGYVLAFIVYLIVHVYSLMFIPTKKIILVNL